ncbi:MAG: hypothetical protein OXH00_03595 [Candidatus Poribacteria bacterium]|nr:hypothetical protein [Candidatus Poribacteria bacterium]
MIKDDIVSLLQVFQFEIRGGLLFTCLIPGIASPNLGFDDVLSLVVADKEIRLLAPGWDFK